MDDLLRLLLVLLIVALYYASYRFGYRRGARDTSIADMEAYDKLWHSYLSMSGYSDALLARLNEAQARLGENNHES
jgi:hypothetical protein